MTVRLGFVKALFRYPVKSMAGESLASAALGGQGLDGDRRFAFVRSGVGGGMPWLTAAKMPSLVLYRPFCSGKNAGELADHVTTPTGETLPLRSEELRSELSARHGAEVQLMHLNQGMFDEAPLSLINLATVSAIAQASGVVPDPRRFRPNILIETGASTPFAENDWPGDVVSFGEGPGAPRIGVMMKDIRCGMLNIDPDTAALAPEMLKTAVRLNENCAGVYGFTLAPGVISVGDPVYLLKGEG